MATIATIREVVYRQTFQDAGFSAGMNSAADAARKLGTAVDGTDDKVRAAGPSWTQANKRIDENAASAARAEAAQRRYAAEIARTNLELAKGNISAAEAAEAERRFAVLRDNAIAKSHQQADAMRRVFGAASEGASVTRQQMQQLAPQLNDVFVTLASGGGGMQALIQQGPQITQVFGGVRETFAALVSTIGPMRLGLIAAGAAFAGFVALGNSADAQLRGLSNRLRATRDDYAALANTVDATARRIAETSSVGTGDARTAGRIIASGRGFSGGAAELEGLVRLSADLAKAFGETVPAAAERLASAMKSPTDAARQMAEQGLRGMNEGLLRSIERMENQGQKANAARMAIDAYRRSVEGAASNQTALQAGITAIGNEFEKLGNTLATQSNTFVSTLARGFAILLSDLRQLNDWLESSRLGRLLGFGGAGEAGAAGGAGAVAQGSPLQDALRVVREQGNRGRQREDIQDRITTLRAGLPGASREDAASIRATIAEQGEALDGLRGPVAEYLENLRKQAALSTIAEGAAREFAQAEVDLAEKHASTGQQAEARALIQRRLNEDLYNASIASGRAASANEALADAIERGGAAQREAQIAAQAQREALKYAEVGTRDYDAAVRVLTADLTAQKNAEDGVRDAMALRQQSGQLEYLQREMDLVGASATARERELAALRETQKIEGEGGDRNNLTARQSRRVEGAREIADTTAELKRQQDAMSELQNIGTQAFDRIGSAITEAFTQGKASMVNFGTVAKGVLSEVIQYLIKIAVLRPVMNAVFGTNLATISDTGGILGQALGTRGASGASGGGLDMGSVSSLYDKVSNLGGNATAFGSYTNTGGMFGGVSAALAAPAYTYGAQAIPQTAALYAEGAAAGSAGSAVTGGATVSYGAALGGVAGIAGGAYGVYSGLQRGGTGGYTEAAGGAIGVGAGLATLGAFGPALAALGPYGLVAAAVLMIVGSMLPGAKASNKTGTAALDLASGSVDVYGQTGAKFSAENRAAANDIIGAVAKLSDSFQTLIGARPQGRVTVDVGSRDGMALGFNAPGMTDRYHTAGLDEAGRNEIFRVAATLMLEQVGPSLAPALQGLISGMPKATAQEILTGLATIAEATQGGNLTANQTIAAGNINYSSFEGAIGELKWVRDVYENLIKAQTPVAAFNVELTKLASTWQEAIGHASALGLATEGLTANMEEQIRKAGEQRNSAVNLATNGITARYLRTQGRSGEADLIDFDAQAATEMAQWKQQLFDWGLSVEQTLFRINHLERTQGAERLAIIETNNAAATQGAQSTIANIRQYVRGMRTGSASPLSILGQYGASSRDFNAVYGAAQAGDARSITDLTSYADTFLQSSRAAYGSGAQYAADFGRVVEALGSIASKSEDSLTASFLAIETRTQTQTLVDELVRLRGEVAGMRQELALNSMTPARAA